MSKGEIATFIVCWIEGFICYLIGYTIGITHDKRTITHECVKDTHDKTEPQTEPLDKDINVRSKTEPQKMCDADCNEDCAECAKEWQDWKDQMWAEAVIASKGEPQTERPCNKCEWYQKYGKCVFGYCHYEYEQAHKDEPQTDCSWR